MGPCRILPKSRTFDRVRRSLARVYISLGRSQPVAEILVGLRLSFKNKYMNTKISSLNIFLIGAVLVAILANLWVWRDDLFGRTVPTSEVPVVQEDVAVVQPRPFLVEDDRPTSTVRVPTSTVKNNTENENQSSVNTSTPATSTSTRSSPAALPASINLPVPFTSQAPEKKWEQPWQDACEEATILMLDAYYKGYGLSPLFAKDELVKMVETEEERGWGLSIELEKIRQLMQEYGSYDSKNWKLRIVEDPTVEDLKRFIANRQPVLVVADGKVLDNPHFRNGGPEYHTLIIRGYTPTHFISNDPGTQFGENFIYTYENLMESIRDWNGGKVKEGRRVVMVVEKL